MTPSKLAKLKRDLQGFRRSQAKARDLEGLARRLGRRLANRGKEPMWESAEFPELNVISIPHHGGRDLSPGVRNIILDHLEDDVLLWEERLDDEGNENGDDGEQDDTD